MFVHWRRFVTTRKEKIAEFEQGYNVMVTGRHVHVTEGMKQHAVERISKLDRIGDRIVDVHVTMDIQKLTHRVDIMMKYAHTFIRSHANSTDMYASIDEAVDRLNRQLRRYKKKLQDHYAKKLPIEEVPVRIFTVEDFEDEYAGEDIEIEKPKATHRVVATETRSIKILSDEEAIMQMELSGDPLMVYRSETDRRLKIIHRREDGNYAIMEPTL
jgi:putative sigma-54 modulation protein